jgi:8-oxo-dGTP diphosphatase
MSEQTTGRHRIAVAALVGSGRVLLVHRHPQREYYPDCWDLVGGHIEVGETPEDAIRRECLEEIGVVIDDPRPITMATSDPAIDLHAFLVTAWSGDPMNRAPDEHDDLRWYAASEVPHLTLADPASLPGILRAAGRVSGQRRLNGG